MPSRHFFRVSEAVALALHAAAILAERPDELVATAFFANALSASENHLAKVMQRLSRAGLVTSTRGPGGGFRLARPAAEITLLEVYEAIEGKLDVTGCLFDRPVCDGRFCILGGLVRSLEQQTWDYLHETTLAQVADRQKGA